MRPRVAAFLVVAATAAVLALTSDQWVPSVLGLFGLAEANSETISILADLAQLLEFALWAVTVLQRLS